MNREDIYRLVMSEDALQSSSERELKQVIKRFPYFQTARILALKKMKLDNSPAFDKELKQSGVYIGDRAKLYTYLHPFDSKKSAIKHVDFLSKETEVSFVPASSFSMKGNADFNSLFLSPENIGMPFEHSVDPLADLESKPQVVTTESSKGWDLIDQFVGSETKKIKVSDTTGAPIVNLAESSIKENHTILTETLASIYIKQKKYEKGIAIFESLSLKFPEKSAYFADRIRELKLIVKNT